MNTTATPSSNEASPIKRALAEIRELRAALAEARRGGEALNEPIAIVGMGMRLPGGVSDADAFTQLLWSGRDAVQTIPPTRWSVDALYDADPQAPGRMTTRYGAFVDEVDRFDAEFFGISPREAETMDPQQRIALEVAWHALEDAGRAGSGLNGSRTGVYLGVANNDYGRALYAHREAIDTYFATGNAYSVVAGRLAYFLGVHGPAIALDTACSSSLVAIHLAAQGLRLRECDMALAGGINLILTPEMNINFSKASMMAADGRCKTFDARADGYVRGEGCGVLVLRRLSDALADGDRIHAIVRGSAINQDGRSGGLTAPNGPAQEVVIRAALAAAGVDGGQIGYVETHGTGTPLGDPIEVGALVAALCGTRDAATALPIGSVKTNLGHLEAAAGVVGVIKAVLALQRGEIPPHLHFHDGNPHIDWSRPVRVPTAVQAWPAHQSRRLAGVSSFGFSGTNAHLVLEAAPAAQTAPAEPPDTLRLLALSARDPAALAELARRHALALDGPVSIDDVCRTAHLGRAHLPHRLAVVAASRAALRDALAAHASGRAAESVVVGHVQGIARPRVAFLFTGQGAQHAGMGRVLYETAPVFRATIDHCATVLAPLLDRGLIELLFGADSPLDETRYAQPVNFAFSVALARLWRSWGVEPVAVMGHSLGEYAAACVAGALSLDDGLRLVAARGRLTHEHGLEGGMAAVFADAAVVDEVIRHAAGRLSIAACNGPEHFVVSGPQAALAAAVERLESRGVRVKTLRVPHAAHSSQIDPVLPAFAQAIDGVAFEAPGLTLISNVTGRAVAQAELADPRYWLRHMREPVRFGASMQTLVAQGITHCIEIGPHPVLLGMAAECVPQSRCAWLPSLRRDRPDAADLFESLQALYVAGVELDWTGFHAGRPGRRITLPGYPFGGRRHWSPLVGAADAGTVTTAERWLRVDAALQRQAEQGPLDLNAHSYPAKWDCLERLTLAHAVRALRESGLFARAGERHELGEVLALGGIAPRYRHLLQRWLDRLVDTGALQRDGSDYVAPAPLPAPDLASLWREADRLFEDNRPLLGYVRQCGDLLGDVLRERESPLETLFPGGSDELAIGLYERSATMRYVNGLAGAAVAALAATAPATRPLRVLEVGAGTGGTTSSLLPMLYPRRTHYVFTDVSDLFLERARERFAAHAFVDYRRFDMESEPQAQGFVPGSFDVIVSANAVHAATDLRLALQRLRSLLAPGGFLLLVESTVHLAWFDMTTGLIEGWQHFSDDLRDDNPLLPAPAWLGALREAGFETAQAWPPAHSDAAALGQHVLVAHVAGDSSAARVAPIDGHDLRRVSAPALAPAPADDLPQRLREATSTERLEILRDFVRDRVVRVLRLDASDPPARDDRLMDLGFDSLMAVQLRNQLAQGVGLERGLAATVMFDHPTIDALAAHLLERLAPAEPVPAAAPPPAAPRPLDEAAVAGMSDAEVEALLMKRLGTS